MSDLSVTCFCAVRDRREWLPIAIRCFERQTYENRRLVIVSDSDGEDISDLVPRDPRIRLHVVERPRLLPDKFNLCCRLAGETDLLCKWDSDEFYGSDRIEDQVELLTSSGKAVVGYDRMLFTDGVRWFSYAGTPGVDVLGTSLMFRREWWEAHPFRPRIDQAGNQLQQTSDMLFCWDAFGAGQLAARDAGLRIVASIHPGNTSWRDTGNGKGNDSYKLLPDFPGVLGFEWPKGALVTC